MHYNGNPYFLTANENSNKSQKISKPVFLGGSGLHEKVANLPTSKSEIDSNTGRNGLVVRPNAGIKSIGTNPAHAVGGNTVRSTTASLPAMNVNPRIEHSPTAGTRQGQVRVPQVQVRSPQVQVRAPQVQVQVRVPQVQVRVPQVNVHIPGH
jgi:hypothetical protein